MGGVYPKATSRSRSARGRREALESLPDADGGGWRWICMAVDLDWTGRLVVDWTGGSGGGGPGCEVGIEQSPVVPTRVYGPGVGESLDRPHPVWIA